LGNKDRVLPVTWLCPGNSAEVRQRRTLAELGHYLTDRIHPIGHPTSDGARDFWSSPEVSKNKWLTIGFKILLFRMNWQKK